MKHRLQLGRFVGHQTHHRLRPPHAAQLVDHAEHRVELRANEHLPRVNGEQPTSTAQQGTTIAWRDGVVAVSKSTRACLSPCCKMTDRGIHFSPDIYVVLNSSPRIFQIVTVVSRYYRPRSSHPPTPTEKPTRTEKARYKKIRGKPKRNVVLYCASKLSARWESNANKTKSVDKMKTINLGANLPGKGRLPPAVPCSRPLIRRAPPPPSSPPAPSPSP